MNHIHCHYESDLPASARDLPDVANSFFARLDPGANLILSNCNIASSRTRVQSFMLKFFTVLQMCF